MTQKSPDAFRTISEVATWLETPAHVLRFWESRFPEVAPVKRAGGRRYYRPEDMRLLGGIKHLLHTEGHTIKSVQDRLRKEGSNAIAAFSQPLDLGTPGQTADAAPAAAAATPPPQTPAGSPRQSDLFTSAGTERAAATPPEAPTRPTPADTPPATTADDATDPAPAEADPLGDEVPPIGFFFDDSDDAVPAEDQSGTFAASLPTMALDEADPEPAAPGDMASPAPAEAAPAADPLPVAELAPPDAPPLPGVTHELRALFPGMLSARQRDGFRACADRLQALAARTD